MENPEDRFSGDEAHMMLSYSSWFSRETDKVGI